MKSFVKINYLKNGWQKRKTRKSDAANGKVQFCSEACNKFIKVICLQQPKVLKFLVLRARNVPFSLSRHNDSGKLFHCTAAADAVCIDKRENSTG